MLGTVRGNIIDRIKVFLSLNNTDKIKLLFLSLNGKTDLNSGAITYTFTDHMREHMVLYHSLSEMQTRERYLNLPPTRFQFDKQNRPVFTNVHILIVSVA